MSSMELKYQTMRAVCLTLCTFMVSTATVMAHPIWHCSRSDFQVANAEDNFTLAALSYDREVIRISLRDLHAVYNGSAVRMSGGPVLSACLIAGSTELTTAALDSIGSKQHKSSSTFGQQPHIYIVQDEASMSTCITKHHPAIGYLSKVVTSEDLGPCF